MTKIEMLNALVEITNDSDVDCKTELTDFLYGQIDQIERRAVKEKERAAKKREEGDAIREQILSCMEEGEFLFAEDILARINVDGATRAKIIARLTALVKLGLVEKESRKTEAGAKRMAYKRIN